MNLLIALYLVAYFQLSISLAPHDITILILSQEDSFNNLNAQKLKNQILTQANNTKPPKVYLSHETFNTAGSWAITPILSEIFEKILSHDIATTTKTKWLIICEDDTIVDLKLLTENLKRENCTDELFLGYPLNDTEATIIHHFAFFANPSWFTYPLFKAGVAISLPLLKRLSYRIKNEKFSNEFYIDASHELSLFAWNNGKGHKLKAVSYFCLVKKTGCAIYDDGAGKPYSACKKAVSTKKILFAVKTCLKFHNDRVPIIQNTWSSYTKHIRFYSDEEDSKIPTISTNVKNTETGHCKKTINILKLVLQEISKNSTLFGVEWVVLVDDDTIMSVADLSKYLGCYNSMDHIYLGERYGYRLHSSDGFNYITGGGGIVFSLNVVKKLVNNCSCPSDSSPDDMIIAMCLQRLGIPSIHSSKFHQARPVDYPIETLQNPISFHKFWQIDPFNVYEKWFRQSNDLHIFSDDNLSDEPMRKHHCTNCDTTIDNEIKPIKLSNPTQHVDL